MSGAPRGPRRVAAMILGGLVSLAFGGLALGVPAPHKGRVAETDLDVMLKQYDVDEKSLQAELDSIALDLKATEARIVGRAALAVAPITDGALADGTKIPLLTR